MSILNLCITKSAKEVNHSKQMALSYVNCYDDVITYQDMDQLINAEGDKVYIDIFDPNQKVTYDKLRKLGIYLNLIYHPNDLRLELQSIQLNQSPKWSRFTNGDQMGWEVTSKGDKRFSPFFMRFPNGMSIENYYQLIIKGYHYFGYSNWKDSKGLPPFQWIAVNHKWTRDEVANDKDYLYIFTDNHLRTSGRNPINHESWYYKKYGYDGLDLFYPNQTQAVIRGLDNAFPISTMRDCYGNQLNNLSEDRRIWSDEINQIKLSIKSNHYKGIKFSSVQFGNGQYSRFNRDRMSLISELLATIGIDNSGETVKGIDNVDNNIRLNQCYFDYFKIYPELLIELVYISQFAILTDVHAVTDNTQAKIYCDIINNLYANSINH